MILNLNSNYRVRGTKDQWILERRVINKKKTTGEEYITWKPEGYYSSLAPLFMRLAREEVRLDEGEYPHDVLLPIFKRLETLENNIIEALKTVPNGGKK